MLVLLCFSCVFLIDSNFVYTDVLVYVTSVYDQMKGKLTMEYSASVAGKG